MSQRPPAIVNPVRLQISFRHFDTVRLNDLGPVNILIGRNNAGKTSIFRAVAEAQKRSGKVERHADAPLSLSLGFEKPEFLDEWLRGVIPPETTLLTTSFGDSRKTQLEYSRGKQEFWTDGVNSNDGKLLEHIDVANRRHDIRSALKSMFGQQWLLSCFFLWHRRKSHIQELLSPGDYESLDPEAEHLAGRLGVVLQGRGALKSHSEINAFLNAVIPGIGKVHVARKTEVVPDDSPVRQEKTFLSVKFVDEREEERGLDSLGGGIEQVLAIALVLLTERNGALFIEEPEAHLHESAQRRLVKQIEKHRGERQIFIATHSPVFMDAFDEACVYRITRDAAGKGLVKRCVSLGDQRLALNDLGVLPSTLLQTNCVIWVEGPTEIHLVKHWLDLVAPELEFHQHYEFAETGGSNLSGYGADIDTTTSGKLHDIFSICRHNFIIADRDAPPSTPPQKEAVQTLTALVSTENFWITWGYEIEWYFPTKAIEEHWGTTLTSPGTQAFYTSLSLSDAQEVKTAGRKKTKHAAWFVRWANARPDPLADWFAGDQGADLQKMLEALVSFIRRANDVGPPSPPKCPSCKRPLEQQPEHD